jgi:hypothetical protein
MSPPLRRAYQLSGARLLGNRTWNMTRITCLLATALLLTACAGSSRQPSSVFDEIGTARATPFNHCTPRRIGLVCVRINDPVQPNAPCTCIDGNAVRSLDVWKVSE